MTMTAWSHRVTCHAAGVTALQSDHAVEILPDSWCRLHMQRYCALTRGAHQLLTVKRSPAQHHFQLHATLLRDYNYMKRTLRQRSTIARANNSTAEASQDTTQSAARRRKKQPKTETIEHSNTTEPRDGLTRCGWVGTYKGANSAAYIKYHDEEWGRPVHDDKQLFELLILEGAQAGLSWSTILAKRDAYRKAFKGFDPAVVAAFGEAEISNLMQNEGIVRHRGKITSTVQNARVFLKLQKEHGSFDNYVWSFVPNKQPIVGAWSDIKQVPAKTPEAEAISKALKAAGMKFVGPTIMYAFMQAAGLVNDHTTNCHCYKLLADSCRSIRTTKQGSQC